MKQRFTSIMLGVFFLSGIGLCRSVSASSTTLAQFDGWRGIQTVAPEFMQGMMGLRDGEEVILTRDDLEYYLGPVRLWGGPHAAAAIDHLQDVRLLKTQDGLRIRAEMDQSFVITLLEKSVVKNFQLYEVDVPRTVDAKMNLVGGLVAVEGLDLGLPPLIFKVKIPLLSARVWLRSVDFDIENQKVTAKIGILGNLLPLTLTTTLGPDMIQNVSLCESIPERLRFKPCQ